MEEFEPIDIKRFARELMALTPSEIELVKKEVKNLYSWGHGDVEPEVTPELLSCWAVLCAGGENEKNSAVENLNIAKWFEEYNKLQEQHREDELWMQDAHRRADFADKFIDYLQERAIGDKGRLIEAVAYNSHNSFLGYVKVTKELNAKQELLLKFEIDGEKHTAKWQPSDNYACLQNGGGMSGDDYEGYLLFPTYKDDEYFCMYYSE